VFGCLEQQITYRRAALWFWEDSLPLEKALLEEWAG
jgi:hypothetical protein